MAFNRSTSPALKEKPVLTPDSPDFHSSPTEWTIENLGWLRETLHKIFPALAVLQWWFFNVSLILLNKWIFQIYKFNFPFTLTSIHFFVSFIGAYICIKVSVLFIEIHCEYNFNKSVRGSEIPLSSDQVLNIKPLVKVSLDDINFRILPMAVVTNLNVCLGNVSLRYIPVTFMQTIKAFTPAATVALQLLFGLKPFDLTLVLSLIPIVGGVTIASITELSFHVLGFLAAFSSTLFTSANSVLAEVLMKGHIDMDSINTVYYMSPFIVLMLGPIAIALEGEELLLWQKTTVDPWMPWIVVWLSGILAFGLNFSLLYAIQATSAMTFNVAGNLKVAVAMLLGWLIYRNPMSIYSTLGCVITVIGCVWYGYIQKMASSNGGSKATNTDMKPLIPTSQFTNFKKWRDSNDSLIQMSEPFSEAKV